jgi:hypothetical protein
MGITVFAVALALLPLPAGQTLGTYSILLVALVYSITLWRMLKGTQAGWTVGAVPTLVDGLLCAGLIPFVGGFDSPFSAILYAVVVEAGMRLGFARSMLLAGAIGLIDLTLRITHGDGIDAAFTVRTGMLVMVSVGIVKLIRANTTCGTV